MKKQEESKVRIRTARVDSLDLYEITEDELEILEHGSPGSLYLLFATSLIPIAISFLITILTTKIESIYLFNIFVIITSIGFIAGVILLVLWIKENRSSTSVSKKIRSRMEKNEKQQENCDPTSTLVE